MKKIWENIQTSSEYFYNKLNSLYLITMKHSNDDRKSDCPPKVNKCVLFKYGRKRKCIISKLNIKDDENYDSLIDGSRKEIN